MHGLEGQKALLAKGNTQCLVPQPEGTSSCGYLILVQVHILMMRSPAGPPYFLLKRGVH